MFKTLTTLIFSLFFCLSLHAKEVNCQALSALNGDDLYPRQMYDVAGKGRLYFYTAPNKKCIEKNVFVIPGDSLVAYAQFGEWTNVMFTNSKTGVDATGWVLTKRLRFTGAFGMEMTAEEHKFFTDAAKAAEAGKLGSPLEKR